MAEPETPSEAVSASPTPRRRYRVARAIGGVLVLILLFVMAVGIGIDTDGGHRFIIDRIAELHPQSGLRIHIGRIEGSIWRHPRIRDLRLYDPQGQFLEAPLVELDWKPTYWIADRILVDRLKSDLVVLQRLPKLRPSKTPQPLLPRQAIHLGLVDLRLRLEAPVAGARRVVRLVGHADTARGRAIIGLKARSNGGDKLSLALDTEPDRDVFDLDARLDSPAGGVIPGLFGSRKTVSLLVDGDGTYKGWHGHARLTAAGAQVADLALKQAVGRYALRGTVTPASVTTGKANALFARGVKVAGDATFADRRLDGQLALNAPAIGALAKGAIDLGRSTFDPLQIQVALREPTAVVPTMTGRDIRLAAELTGAFRAPAFRYALTTPHVAFGQAGFEDVRAAGEGKAGGPALTLPIRFTIAQATGLGPEAGDILRHLDLAGALKITPKLITGEGLTLKSDKLNGTIALFVDLVTGQFGVTASGGMKQYLIPNLGLVDVLTQLSLKPGAGGQAQLEGTGHAWVRRFDNPFLKGLTGGLPELTTHMFRLPDGSLRLTDMVLTAPAIRLAGTGLRRKDGSFQFSGGGTQTIYGPFKLTLDGMIDHPVIRVLLDHPVDALGLENVQLALDPIPGGFAMKANGGSTLGPFTAGGSVMTPLNAAATINVDRLGVTGTVAKGVLTAQGNGVTGTLGVAGGGLDGTVAMTMAGALQRIQVALAANDANLAGDAGIGVRRGKVTADVLLDPVATKLDATIEARGLSKGSMFLARTAANLHMVGDKGTLRASISGSRGKAFAFQTETDLAPDSYVFHGQGQVDGKPVALTSPGALTKDGDGWKLAPTSLTYGGGSATISGRFGAGPDALDAAMQNLPLAILDMVKPGLGLGGEATGRLTYARATPQALPEGHASLRVRGLTRSGLVLASTPMDFGIDALLSGDRAAARAIAQSGGQTIGRAQVALGPLPPQGTLWERISHAATFGQLRYKGPVDTLWRLAGVETADLSGPVEIGADIGGTVDNPTIKGSLATSAMRIESATTGTVIDRIRARGRFDGSKLVIDRFDGATKENGTLSGHAALDFGGLHGLGIDAAIDANRAVLLARDDIAATVTGPLTVKSDGRSGTIAGKVRLDKSAYRFGAYAAAGVPHLAVNEINRPADIEVAAPLMPWQLDLQVNAPNQLMVRGLGLDSEWRTKLSIQGDVANPAIEGRADLIHGSYEFAGRRFDLDRGIIRFTGSVPVDPALDIQANVSLNGTSANLRVSGTGTQPEISFTSTPALPEDELLSRLLFGTSIGSLSAPEALQLAAAVNGLRNGGKGGLDPLNAVRKVARLDRLRIESADPTTGQKTSVAAGKYLTRRAYVELVTDGAGYSASRLEFQVTRWLSLLATVSTIGRQSASVRVSKDY